jgi:hypothetical protein
MYRPECTNPKVKITQMSITYAAQKNHTRSDEPGS